MHFHLLVERTELSILPQAKRVGLLVVEEGVNLCIGVNNDETVHQVLAGRVNHCQKTSATRNAVSSGMCYIPGESLPSNDHDLNCKII